MKKGHPWKDDSIMSGNTLDDLQKTDYSPTKLKKAAKKNPLPELAIQLSSSKDPLQKSRL